MKQAAAARWGDSIEHRQEALGLIVGLAAGMCLGVTLAMATVATGGLALGVVATVAVGGALGGASGGAFLGEDLGGLPCFAHKAGIIQQACAATVFINGMPAATMMSNAACSKHPLPLSAIADGSSSVSIEGLPAARKGDQLTCSARVMEGSPNVFIGGQTVRGLEVTPIVPSWVHNALLVAGIAGGLMTGLSPVTVILSLVAGTGAGLTASYIAGQIWGDGSTEQVLIRNLAGFVAGSLTGLKVQRGINKKLPEIKGPLPGFVKEGTLGIQKYQQLSPFEKKWGILEVTPEDFAKEWQGAGDYPGVDNYRNITLPEGTIVVAGLPGQGSYYTTLNSLRRTGLVTENIWEGLQVKPHNEFGYRKEMGIFVLTEDAPAAIGIVKANPQYGKGGMTQIVIPGFDGITKHVTSIRLQSK